MKKTEGNNLTVDQENRIIRKCNHAKSIGAMAVYVDTGCSEDYWDDLENISESIIVLIEQVGEMV